MSAFFDTVIAWASANPGWIGLIVFLIAFAESLAIVGLLVPGVAMLFVAGALVGAGVLDFWMVYWWVVAGAILGDGLSFWLGRRYRYQLRSVWPFSRYTDLIDKGVDFFQQWGGKSVVVGRFVGPIRAVVPLIAGMLEMPVPRFVIINILAAFVWAIAYLLPGIAVGASLELASQIAFHLVVMLLALLLLIWLLLWIAHRLARWLTPHSNNFLQALLRFAEGDTLPRRIAAALADSQHPEAKGLSIMALVIVLSAFAVTAIATTLLDGGGFGHLDQLVHEYLGSIRHPSVDWVMVLITTLGDGWLLGWVWLTIFVLLWLQHRPTAWHWLAAVLYVAVVVIVLKYGLQIPRPADAASAEWSFPSAHTLGSTVLYGFFAVLLATRFPPEQRWPIYALAISVAALVGVSRLYLGVHWFSDVFAGWVLGLLWVAILGLAWRHHQHPPLQMKPLVGGLLLALMLSLAWQLSYRQQAQLVRYQPLVSQGVLTEAAWLDGAPLPVSRQTLVAREWMTLRVTATPEQVIDQLEYYGWRPVASQGAITLLHYLSVETPLLEIPPLPKVYDGKLPKVQMLLLRDGKRYVLRLWKTRYLLGDCPVLIGHVMAEDVDTLAGAVLRVRSRVTSESSALTEQINMTLQSFGAQCH